MEKDDFRYTLSFGDDVFGGPDWKTMVPRGRRQALCRGRHRAAAARCRRPAAEAQFRPCRRSRLGDPRGDRQSRAPSGSSSTSAWTGRSTTARSPPISRARAVSTRSTFRAGTTRTGWTTARPNTCWTGSRTTIWKCLSTRPGNTSVRERSSRRLVSGLICVAGTSVSVCFKGGMK